MIDIGFRVIYLAILAWIALPVSQRFSINFQTKRKEFYRRHLIDFPLSSSFINIFLSHEAFHHFLSLDCHIVRSAIDSQ